NRHAGFRRMVGIVEADADELGRACDAGPETWLVANQLKRRGIDLCELLQRSRRQGGAGDVVDMSGQATNLAVRIEHAWTLMARLSITQQFQRNTLLRSGPGQSGTCGYGSWRRDGFAGSSGQRRVAMTT